MNIDERCINTIRFLSADGVEKASSGHPGLPMGCATAAHALWSRHLNFNPDDTCWINRDRFVLSAGHGSMLVYSLLHLYGLGLSMDDLKSFRQWDSKTPGHPEYGHTPGIETTTGPLGQGLSTAVGMAIAETMLAAIYNRDGFDIINNFTYVIAGDGDMMEGITSEASSLAGHLKLGRLICIYDDNNITIDGQTSLSFSEDVGKRYEAYGWHVIRIDDGNDLNKISDALKEAGNSVDKPTLIILKTIIGFGSPNKQGTEECHGSPLGKDELYAAKKNLNWYPDEEFYVPDDVTEYFRNKISEKRDNYQKWLSLYNAYKLKYPDLAKDFESRLTPHPDADILKEISEYKIKKPNNATRNSGGEIINFISQKMDCLVGGSADLNPSTKTYLNADSDYNADNRSGKNLRFGIREHAMAAILNGMAVYGGFRVFGSTFFVFSDYMKPSLRLAALMKIPVIHVFTHDSIGVGEDGPTHEPVEHLVALRAIPNMTVIRPADGNETLFAWIEALKNVTGPTSLILTRQNLPDLDVNYCVEKGAYTLGDEYVNPDIILMASGSEVQHIYNAKNTLQEKGYKVQAVSFPSFELFEKQSAEYKEKVLPPSCIKRLAVEAGSDYSWYRYTGLNGDMITMNTFGASAPGDILMEKFGFTSENVVRKAMEILNS